jgi:hypothetical protein
MTAPCTGLRRHQPRELRQVPRMSDRVYCPEPHTYGPPDVFDWHRWAAEQRLTHDQQQCPDCRLWVIWRPRTTGPVAEPEQLGLHRGARMRSEEKLAWAENLIWKPGGYSVPVEALRTVHAELECSRREIEVLRAQVAATAGIEQARCAVAVYDRLVAS